MANHCCSHATDRAGAGDQHVFAKNVERKRSVHGVAQRVEDRGDIEIDAGAVMPHVGHRNGNVFGKCSWPVHPDSHGMGTQMPAACEAVSASSTHDMAFAAYEFPREEISHVRSNADDFADELVADHH